MKLLEDARAAIAEKLSCEKGEVYFTQAGTVANNTAVFGAAAAMRRRGNKIVTTAFEHPSVGRAMDALEKQGFTVVRLSPDAYGRITLEQFENAIDQDTILVSCMAVNNEVGSIQPMESLKRVIKRKKSEALLHIDAVQAFCKIPLKPSKWGVDLMSMSAHKIHGIKGAGALFVKKGVRIVPYILGGGQENGLCSGTESMPAIAAFAAAAREINVETALSEVTEKRAKLLKMLADTEIERNSPEDALPYIVNLSLPGIPSQVTVNYLSGRNVCISAGSACSKGHRSDTLLSMGLTPSRIDSAVRISLSGSTTEEELVYCAEVLHEALRDLKKR